MGSERDPVSVDTVESNGGRHLTPTPGFHTHVLPHPCKHTYTHTHTHSRKERKAQMGKLNREVKIVHQ